MARWSPPAYCLNGALLGLGRGGLLELQVVAVFMDGRIILIGH
jgi:hypothetical protein